MKKMSLKRQAKIIKKKMLADHKPFFDEMMEKNYPSKKVNKKKVVSIIAPSFAAVLMSVVFFVFILPLMMSSSGLPSEKNYFVENEKQIDSNYHELTLHLNGLNLEINGAEISCYQVYDSKSGDILYFIVDFTINEFEFVTVYFYVNTDYKNQKSFKTENTDSPSINGFELRYEKHVEIDDDFGIYRVKYQANTLYKEIGIYIEHTQLSVDEESNFFAFFEQTFKMPA